MQIKFIHLVVRAQYPHAPFVNRENCVIFWQNLRRAFPRALACVLMLNHLHLVLETDVPDRERIKMIGEIRAFTRRLGYNFDNLWEIIPYPSVIPDREQLRRVVRYVHLNPCRKGLAKDPLEWEWSTHRDILGLCEPTWVAPARLAKSLGIAEAEFAAKFHAYVSSDPCVSSHGSALPGQLPPAAWATPQSAIAAVQIALRTSGVAHQSRTRCRRIAVRLLNIAAPARVSQLSPYLGITRQAFSKSERRPLSVADQRALAAAQRVLADARLMPPSARQGSLWELSKSRAPRKAG